MIFSLATAALLVISACLILTASRRTTGFRAAPVKVLVRHRKR
jgi:hypothetical protein